MNLYQYAVIHRPDEGNEQVIVWPTWCMANDETHVRMIASRAISPERDSQLADIDIEVRPF